MRSTEASGSRSARLSKEKYDRAVSTAEQRRFRIEAVPYKGRTIKLVNLESWMMTNPDLRPMVVPDNWEDILRTEMKDTSMVFMAYFLPELERDLFPSRIFGEKARSWAVDQGNLSSAYEPVAKIAAEEGKVVGVADIATGPMFSVYEMSPINYPFWSRGTSAYGLNPSISERIIPQVTDARRMWTTDALKKMSEERVPEGGSLMYVGYAAYNNRIRNYLQEEPTVMDAMRRRVYTHTMLGLRTSIRLYEHNGDQWEQVENIPYLTTGQQLRPYGIAAGVGAVAAGGAYLVRRRASGR